MNPNHKTFIGISGKARHGKDTLATMIHLHDPALTRVLALADALKAHCRVQYGMTKKNPGLLQEIGVGMRERHGEDFWIEILAHAAAEYNEPIIIVPDVRFPNEAAFVRSRGGVLVRVARYTNAEGEPYIADDRDPNHVSETALDQWADWDAVVGNWPYTSGSMRHAAKRALDMAYSRWRSDRCRDAAA